MSVSTRVTVTKDSVTQVVRAINELVGKQVLVGIPDSTTNRQQEVDQPITNATLGYIHEHGSPAANIPARPFLVPGVEKAEEPALDQMQKAALATMRGDPRKAEQHMNRAGLIAMSSARREISEGDFEPLSPSTIRNRHRQRQTKSMRESERAYLELVDHGMEPAGAQEATGIRPLLNTGQLRNAITYVLRQKRERS